MSKIDRRTDASARPTPITKPPRESDESRHLVKGAFDLARSLRIARLLVQADEIRDVRLVEVSREKERIIWITRDPGTNLTAGRPGDVVVPIPDAPLNRTSQLGIGLFLAVLNGHLRLDESVICLTGVAGTQRLDTLLIANPGRDFPWFRKRHMKKVTTRHFARVIHIALRFAEEGREGKPIGTIFVLGDLEELSPYLHQLILNPCAGHPRRSRSIHNPEFYETLREFAAMDGAFVISEKGVVESAGTYLDAPVKKARLPPGLGARHAAALAMTAETDSIAVVVSSSSGTVSVFHDGEIILELEKPQPSSKPSQSRILAGR